MPTSKKMHEYGGYRWSFVRDDNLPYRVGVFRRLVNARSGQGNTIIGWMYVSTDDDSVIDLLCWHMGETTNRSRDKTGSVLFVGRMDRAEAHPNPNYRPFWKRLFRRP